jgi:hypothetical protein
MNGRWVVTSLHINTNQRATATNHQSQHNGHKPQRWLIKKACNSTKQAKQIQNLAKEIRSSNHKVFTIEQDPGKTQIPYSEPKADTESYPGDPKKIMPRSGYKGMANRSLTSSTHSQRIASERDPRRHFQPHQASPNPTQMDARRHGPTKTNTSGTIWVQLAAPNQPNGLDIFLPTSQEEAINTYPLDNIVWNKNTGHTRTQTKAAWTLKLNYNHCKNP